MSSLTGAAVHQVDPDYYTAVVHIHQCRRIDMNMVPDYYQLLIGTLKQAVLNGDITRSAA